MSPTSVLVDHVSCHRRRSGSPTTISPRSCNRASHRGLPPLGAGRGSTALSGAAQRQRERKRIACLPWITPSLLMAPPPEGREDASARLGGWGRTVRSQSSRSLCGGVTWGAHTCAQLPRIDPLTRAAGERKRLDQGVEYVFRGRNQLRTRPSRVQAVSSTFGDHLRLDPARIAGVGARDLDKGRPVPLVRSSLALAASTSAAPGQTTVRRRQGAEQWVQKERTLWSDAEQVSWQRYRRWPP